MRNLSLLLTISLSLCLCVISTHVQAQPQGDPIVIGQSFSLHSDILNEERPYLVYLPQGYDPNGEPLAVMYLMDGQGHFHHTTGIVKFLANQGRIPQMMVVAIPNTTDRTRDLTPSIEKDEEAKQQMPTAGSANKTLAFIKDELIPHIKKTYHTNSYQMLVGHSFGGIFAVNSLLTEPDLFDAYISISPSMWWDQQHLVDRAETFLKETPELDVFFYMTMGNEGGDMLGGAMKLAALFEEKAPKEFGWDFKVMEEETHGSVPHRSTYYGLEAIFKDWYRQDIADLYTAGGMTAVNKHLASLEKKLGYKKQLTEMEYNNLGYQLMGKGNLKGALSIFQQNVATYPKSFNVWDSMAEAYMEMGNHDSSIIFYKKALELHPGNQGAVQQLAKMDVTYDPMDTKVKLSGKQMKAYVGSYDVQGMTLFVSIEGGQLMAEVDPVLPKQEMIPFPDHRFLLSKMNAPIVFEMNERKEVSGYSAQMGIGQLVEGKKK